MYRLLDSDFTKKFAIEWIDAWNTHHLPSIMNHYADQIDFRSPVIKLINFNEEGRISNKVDLQQYFAKALNTYPNLHFHLHEVCTGVDSVVLFYTSINQKKSAEFMQFDESGKVVKVLAHYN